MGGQTPTSPAWYLVIQWVGLAPAGPVVGMGGKQTMAREGRWLGQQAEGAASTPSHHQLVDQG